MHLVQEGDCNPWASKCLSSLLLKPSTEEAVVTSAGTEFQIGATFGGKS